MVSEERIERIIGLVVDPVNRKYLESWNNTLISEERRSQTRLNNMYGISHILDVTGWDDLGRVTGKDICEYWNDIKRKCCEHCADCGSCDDVQKNDCRTYMKNLGSSVAYIRILKAFMNHIHDGILSESQQKAFKSIGKAFCKIKPRKLDSGKDLIHDDTYTELLRVAGSNKSEVIGARDMAMLALLYRLGARRSEITHIKLAGVTETVNQKSGRTGYMIHLDGKTGARDVSIFDDAEIITAWLAIHPYASSKDAYLICDLSNRKNMTAGKGITAIAMNYILKGIVDKYHDVKVLEYMKSKGYVAGDVTELTADLMEGLEDIVKDDVKEYRDSLIKVFPHLFRHGRVTMDLQTPGATVDDVKKLHGWSDKSLVWQNYVHSSDARQSDIRAGVL